MQIDTIRPISVRKAGAGTAIPSGTLSGVTADNSDSTYIRALVADGENNWSLRLAPHTPAAGYQRHALRARVRAATNAGTVEEDIDIGRGDVDYLTYASITPTSSFADYSTAWLEGVPYGLELSGALSDLNIGGGWLTDAADGATELRTSECYVDIDTRFHPDYAPEVQDNAGVDQSGGLITDTNQPVLYFGTVGYDDLPALDWSVTVKQGATTVFSGAGSGVPPTSVLVDTGLPDAAYTAEFVVRSTIRGADPFAYSETLAFTIENVVPPNSPPLVTVTEQDGGYLVSWTYPGGQPWDDDYVVTEVWRDDCTGSQRIATVPDGLNGEYLDLAIPQLDPQPGVDCEPSSVACDITYRVRYWGYISTTIEVPDSIPDSLILAWPSTIGTIPSGWSRVTALDGRYPRGSNGTAAPTTTGGAATHTHNAPAHVHSIGAHVHALGGSTEASVGSTSTHNDVDGLDITTTPHAHSRPAATEANELGTSGSTTPGMSAANNLPLSRDVIWIQPAGGQTAFPVGVLGFSAESISGWTPDASSSGRFLRGAAAVTNGGVNSGSATHTHTVNGHTHTGVTHGHPITSTGLGTNPIFSVAGERGSQSGEFLPQHTHRMNVFSENTGTLGSGGGNSSSSATLEPTNRRLRVLRNTTAAIQTRIIGLWLGTVASLPSTLTLCNGSNGTPDMRTRFCRDIGSDSVNSTGGLSDGLHTHTVGTHSHPVPGHTHGTNVQQSVSAKYPRSGSSPTTSTASVTHTHASGDTASTSPPSGANGSGTTTSGNIFPPYHEVHFVRLDGVVSGGPLPVPELKVSQFASVTVPSFTYGDDLDRLANLTTKVAIGAGRSHEFPKLVIDSTPLDGGLHTVATTPAGEDMALTIGVESKAAIDELESVLSSDRVYFSPIGGTPGWYAPGSWSVSNPAPDVWVVSVPLVRQDWPATPEPEEYL